MAAAPVIESGDNPRDTEGSADTIAISQLYICNYCSDCFASGKERYAHKVDKHWKDLITECEACVKSFLLKQEPDPSHECHLHQPSEPSPAQSGTGASSGANKNDGAMGKGKKRAVSATARKKQNQEMVFTCKVCNHVCMSVLDMLNHKQSHHVSITQCHYCHLSCKNEPSLVEHLKLHANQQWHFCRTCSEGFDREATLFDHEKSEHVLSGTELEQQIEVELCSESNNWIDKSESPNDSMQTKKFSCRYCLKKFSSQVDYQQHVNSYHPKRHACKICGRAFVRPCEVRVHMKHHCEERNFVCQYCAKSFKRQAHLDCHILSHTGEKKFQCRECGKAFKAKRTLIGHEMKHLGKQPYQCKDCGIRFTLKSSLVKHEECHSANRARVRCPKCDKDFCSKESLVIHDKAVHLKIKQFVCETCGTAFSYQSHLKKHQMIHKNEKPFKCNFCDKFFRLAYSRVIHECEHTGKKPYQCPLCSKNYATKARMERHCKIHNIPVVLKQQVAIAAQRVQNWPVPDIQVTECNPCSRADMEKHHQDQSSKHMPTTEELQRQAVGSALLVCNICSKRFTSYCDWMAHHQTHNPAHLNPVNDTQETINVMLSLMSGAAVPNHGGILPQGGILPSQGRSDMS